AAHRGRLRAARRRDARARGRELHGVRRRGDRSRRPRRRSRGVPAAAGDDRAGRALRRQRRRDAAEVHVLLPQADIRAAVPPDWLKLCRAARDDVARVLAEMPTRAEREPKVGEGEGGDDTTAIDAAAEAVILARFRGEDVRIVSEEVGIEGDGRWTVVVDPIDGSLNAKRGIPFFSISVAVAEGDTMDDVAFGYVYDFGAREEWTATRGGGALLGGVPITERPKDELEILSFEATTTAYVSENAARFDGVAYRLRVMGSLAVTLCHLAAGRVDGVVSLKPARSVDIAAAQLLVREQGLSIELPDDPPFAAAPLDLEGRSRVVAAGNDELCARLATALTA